MLGTSFLVYIQEEVDMKKIILTALAATLVTGAAFASK